MSAAALPFVLEELRDPDGALARQAFALYEAAFPEVERVPTATLAEGLRAAAARESSAEATVPHFWAARDGEQLLGLALFTSYREPRLGFLDYMAIQPAARNRGLGSALFGAVAGQVSRDLSAPGRPALGLAFEVDRPQDASDPAERRLRERRIGFYERNGAVLLPQVDFLAPPLWDGAPPVPYYLMYRPADAGAPAPDRALLEAIVVTALVHAYELSPDDGYVTHALASLAPGFPAPGSPAPG
jgi:GNAT superfamily N-acetyltransferase